MANEPDHRPSTPRKPRISGRWRRTGGTRRAARRCCTGSIRCGSNISATGSTAIGGWTSTGLKPLAGKRAADVGCGAGLLAEPLARLGAEVTGIDAAPENIAAAREHALGQGLEIDYRVGGTEALDGRYDLVTSLEVVEHVADPAAFVGGLAAAVAEGGLLILSTPSRTAWSRLVMIVLGEGSGQIPRGTHDWDKFINPDELCALVRAAGLEVVDVAGLSWTPARGFVLADDLSLNYLVTAKR